MESARIGRSIAWRFCKILFFIVSVALLFLILAISGLNGNLLADLLFLIGTAFVTGGAYDSLNEIKKTEKWKTIFSKTGSWIVLLGFYAVAQIIAFYFIGLLLSNYIPAIKFGTLESSPIISAVILGVIIAAVYDFVMGKK